MSNKPTSLKNIFKIMRFLNGVEGSSYSVRIFQKNGLEKRERWVKLGYGRSMDLISMLWLWGWIYVQQADHSEKYLQNYEISERSRRIVVHRSHISKNQGKKRESVSNLDMDIGWTGYLCCGYVGFYKTDKLCNKFKYLMLWTRYTTFSTLKSSSSAATRLATQPRTRYALKKVELSFPFIMDGGIWIETPLVLRFRMVGH